MTLVDGALILLVILLTSAGQLGQKRAVTAGPTLGDRLRSPWLWIALVCLGLALLVWFVVLQRVPVGVAYPLLSLNTLAVTLLARFVFGEAVDGRAWCGCLCIVVGAGLLGSQA